jgi:hypothetical protein
MPLGRAARAIPRKLAAGARHAQANDSRRIGSRGQATAFSARHRTTRGRKVDAAECPPRSQRRPAQRPVEEFEALVGQKGSEEAFASQALTDAGQCHAKCLGSRGDSTPARSAGRPKLRQFSEVSSQGPTLPLVPPWAACRGSRRKIGRPGCTKRLRIMLVFGDKNRPAWAIDGANTLADYLRS